MNPDDKAKLLEQYRKHPLPAYLGMACMVCFIASVILFQVLQGRVEVQTRYLVTTLLHLSGAIAGLAAIRLTPPEMKAISKAPNVRLTLLANSGFFLLFAFRLLKLLGR